MSARTLAVVAGLIGGIAWMVKLLIMTAQEGPDPDSLPESVAFFVGLLGVLAGSVAAGAHLARSRSPGWRVSAGVAGVVAVGLVISFGQATLTALPGDSWVQAEAIFGIVGVLAVVAALTAVLRQPTGRVPATIDS